MRDFGTPGPRIHNVIGALIAAVSLVSLGNSASTICEKFPANGPRSLPAAVAIHTTCGGFFLRPGGRVGRAPMPEDWASWAPTGSWRAAPDTYVSARFGDIRVVRDARTIWRSSRRYKFTSSIVIGRGAVAFSLFEHGRVGPLYVARLGGRERLVLRGEDPLAFLPSGLLLTQRWSQGKVVVRLRRLDGRLVRVVAPRARMATFDNESKTIFYVTRNRMLARFDGKQRVGLARVPRGWRWPWLRILDSGGVAVIGDRGLAIVRPRGGILASAGIKPPTRHRGGDVMNGDPILSTTRAVAFTSTRHRHGFTSGGQALVSVLRPGDRRATVVFRHRVQNFGCGWSTSLAWKGDWLLYRESATQRVVAIDTARGRTVNLTPFVRSLPGRTQPPNRWKVAFWARWR